MDRSMLFLSLLVPAVFGWAQERRKPVVALGSAEMIVEWVPGQEAILRITAESEEEELASLQVLHPDGHALVDLSAPGSARGEGRGGLSNLEVELRETSLEKLFATYAQGRYDLRASTLGGKLALGSANLSFDLPTPPLILNPRPGALVEGSGLNLAWSSSGEVAGYEIQLEQGDDDGLRVKLPPAQTSFRVPYGILAGGKETTFEVAAIGSNGNRTVVEVHFVTRP